MVSETRLSRSPEERALFERYERRYELAGSEVLLQIERATCGCDYGATSWTTRAQAEDASSRLRLAPGRRLLEVGAGAGWPGLYLARHSGCRLTLLDLPISGLRIARRRAAADGFARTCHVAVADGAALPFRDGSFDAVFHSDVLCCLAAKRAVLQACRSVVRAGGHMVFAVILIPPRLSAAERRSAAAGAPTFVDCEMPYPKLLGRTGWNLIGRVDLTAAFLDSVQRVRAQEEAHRKELEALFGADETRERLERRRKTVTALERGLLRRELFNAVPQA